jgi:hypothetical protein
MRTEARNDTEIHGRKNIVILVTHAHVDYVLTVRARTVWGVLFQQARCRLWHLLVSQGSSSATSAIYQRGACPVVLHQRNRMLCHAQSSSSLLILPSPVLEGTQLEKPLQSNGMVSYTVYLCLLSLLNNKILHTLVRLFIFSANPANL